MRKRHLLWGALVLLPIAACADVMNALESMTDENTAEGKIIRGANRLRKSAQDLDPSEEHFIGRSVAAQILSMPEYRLANDQAAASYLNRIGQALVATNDGVRRTFADYRFALLDTTEVNAFACPGGLILVSRGLLQKTASEDEVAAVLAHEIAHVSHKHGLEAIKEGHLTEAFKYLIGGAAQAALSAEDMQKLTDLFGDSVKDVVQTLVTAGYSREAEAQADGSGREFLANTGYDPQALSRVLQKMNDVGGQGGMFSTHPAPQDRITSLGSPLPFDGSPVAAETRLQRYHQNLKL